MFNVGMPGDLVIQTHVLSLAGFASLLSAQTNLFSVSLSGHYPSSAQLKQHVGIQ